MMLWFNKKIRLSLHDSYTAILPDKKITTDTEKICYTDCLPGSNLGGQMFDSDICKKKDSSALKTYESEYETQEAVEYEKRQLW